MSTERELGELSARVAGLENDVSELVTEVRKMRSTMDQARGGWKTVLLVAGVAGSMGALMAKALPWIAMGPR